MGRLVPVLCLVFVTTMLACAGDEETSLDEYLSTYNEIGDEIDSGVAEVDFDTIRESDTFEELQDRTTDAFDELASLVEQAIERLEELNPPAAAKDAHEEQLDAAREFKDEFDSFIDDVRESNDAEDLQRLVEGFEDRIEESGRRLDEVCNDLQALADDRSVEIDLDC